MEIKRDSYLNQLVNARQNGFIKVVTGPHRCGKSYLLKTLKVPSTYRGMRIVYSYDDGFHDDYEVSEELQIEYYD